MKHRSSSAMRVFFLLGLAIWVAGIAWAKQSEKYQSLDENKSADYYLQKGHRSNRNGDIEEAISFYRKALDVQPDFSPAIYSLERALSELELKKWALENISNECIPSGQHINFSKSIKCANDFFCFNGEPIHPKIIRALNTWLSDTGDQIVSIT